LLVPYRKIVISNEIVAAGLVAGLSAHEIAVEQKVSDRTVERLIAKQRAQHGEGWPGVAAERRARGLDPLPFRGPCPKAPARAPLKPDGVRTTGVAELDLGREHTRDELLDFARKTLLEIAATGGRDDGPRVAAAKALAEMARDMPEIEDAETADARDGILDEIRTLVTDVIGAKSDGADLRVVS